MRLQTRVSSVSRGPRRGKDVWTAGGYPFAYRHKTSGASPTPAERFDMAVNGFVSAIIVGMIVGVLGRLLIPGKQPIGIVLTLLVGIGAAFLGTFVAGRTGITYEYGIDWFELLIQVVVAGIAVVILTAVFRRQITPTTARPRARSGSGSRSGSRSRKRS